MADKRDYYEVLGVSRSANDDEIKRAFRKLAMQHHPDRAPAAERHAAEERFKELNEAYEVLSDREKRKRYDHFGHAGFTAGMGAGGPGGVDLGDLFGDLFSDFFGAAAGGRRGGGRRGQRGDDLQYTLDLEFEEAAFGCEKKIEIPREESCQKCDGSGAASPDALETCRMCRGTGHVTVQQGFFSLRTTCTRCGGQGVSIKEPCEECRGRGRVQRTRTLSVTIPAGVDNEFRLKLSREGEPGLHGGPSGDLYVLLHVRQHERFQRDGDHLLLDYPISFTQAALGAELDVPTLRGHRKLHIPAGTQTGKIFKIRSEGIDNVHGHGKGDLIVRMVVVTPTNLSSREKELLAELAKIRGDSVEMPQKSFFDKVRAAFE